MFGAEENEGIELRFEEEAIWVGRKIGEIHERLH